MEGCPVAKSTTLVPKLRVRHSHNTRKTFATPRAVSDEVNEHEHCRANSTVHYTIRVWTAPYYILQGCGNVAKQRLSLGSNARLPSGAPQHALTKTANDEPITAWLKYKA